MNHFRQSFPNGRDSDPLKSELGAVRELYLTGLLERAEAACRKLLKRRFNQPDALNFLGLIELKRGKPDRAVKWLSLAAKCHPRFAEAHQNLAVVLLQMGECAAAAEHSRRAVELAPKMAEAHHNLASALHRMERHSESEQAYRAALGLAPNRAGWLRDFAAFLMERRRFDEALLHIDRALSLASGDPGFRLTRAEILFRSGDIAGAVAAYARETEISPASAAAWSGLGHMESFQGRFTEAAAHFRRALECDPNLANARFFLAEMNSEAAKASEIDQLTAQVQDENLPRMERIRAGFALGKMLDDAGAYDEAFARFEAANASYREFHAASGLRFDVGVLRQAVDNLIAAPPPEIASENTELPVFVVGMPRSGTSLVEQILASHPAVFGAGELPDIPRIAEGGQVPDVTMARNHIARLQALSPAATRVVDKLPGNLFFLDLIGRMFNRPRIILCRRDPRDTSLSCYFTLFRDPSLWSYDLLHCGQKHFETERLANHAMTLPGFRILTVQYESLVADLESECRRLIDFLGLPWDPRVLDFHRTDRIVTTRSFWQVRQPIYSRSVGRWKHYEKHLAPLLAGLNGDRAP